jgi:mycobactin peptide synthetase MbtE
VQALIGLLEELLEITGVVADDNFFALGGDSIVSVQWATRAGALGLALTPVMVFEHQSIAELAAAVDGAAAPAAGDAAPAAGGAAPPAERASVSEPMSASGLDAAELAGLAAAWHGRT